MARQLLILGASGRLGAVLEATCSKMDFNVIAHSSKGPEELQADVTIGGSLQKLMTRWEPEVIINLIALTDVEQCERDPIMSDLVNVGPVREITNYLSDAPHVRFVHISTDHVYGTPGIHEESEVRPLNRYAQDKLRAEDFVTKAGGVSLRTNFFGRSSVPTRPSYSDWLLSSIRSGKVVSVSDDILFNPLRMKTVCDIIGRIVSTQLQGVYNLGATTAMSKYEFARAFLAAVGENPAVVEKVSKNQIPHVPRPFDMRMKVDRLCRDLRVELPTLTDEIEMEAGVYQNGQ